jgi:hypothetical protein
VWLNALLICFKKPLKITQKWQHCINSTSQTFFVLFLVHQNGEEKILFCLEERHDEENERKKGYESFIHYLCHVPDIVCFITGKQSPGNTRFCCKLPLLYKQEALKAFCTIELRKGTQLLNQ